MKIIDENGRLFKSINVIDAVVVVFLLSLIPVFYFGYRVYKEKVSYSVRIRNTPINKSLKYEIDELRRRISDLEKRCGNIEYQICLINKQKKISR